MAHHVQRRRPRYGPRRRSAPGSPPGTVVVDPLAPAPRMQLFSYGEHAFREAPEASLDDVDAGAAAGLTLWLNVDGLGHADTLERIGTRFALHPLALEDVVNVHQRPKFEAYDDHLFLIVRTPVASSDAPVPEPAGLQTEQVAIVLGRDHVVTFQESAGAAFEPVRHRLRKASSALRRRGADYLAYALLDAAMLRDDTPLIAEHTRVYLRDCIDHTIQLIDMIETYREIASGLVDIHLASVSNRMNEVMKVLTIIATIFIPLTFVAGIYGMNFDPDVGPWSMPELRSRFGYPVVMLVMLSIAIGLVAWFRRLGWIGREGPT